jgi:hypothetical protein
MGACQGAALAAKEQEDKVRSPSLCKNDILFLQPLPDDRPEPLVGDGLIGGGPDINMKGVLRKVIERMNPLTPAPTPQITNRLPERREASVPNTKVRSPSLCKNDILFLQPLPDDRPEPVSQVLWGSIGYSMGACQGAALAAKEQEDRRTILFIGPKFAVPVSVRTISFSFSHCPTIGQSHLWVMV